MFIVDLPSGKVGITFVHRRYPKPRFDPEVCATFMNGITYCEVYRITATGDAVLYCEGKGIAKHPDPYCKREGRKRSLTSAMRKTRPGPGKDERIALFDKSERAQIWVCYWYAVGDHQVAPVATAPPAVDTQGNEITGP